jgi:hypothetical protein
MYSSPGVLIAVAALTFISWVMLFRAFRRHVLQGHDSIAVIGALSAASLFPIAVYVSWAQFDAWIFNIGFDDFHLGEQLLPYQQVFGLGSLPYVDFAPIHGLTPISYGFVNKVFFAGTAATFPMAVSVVAAFAIALTYLSAHFYAGPLPALALTMFSGVIWDRFMFMIPAVLFILNPGLMQRQRLWLWLWPIVAGLSVLFNSAVGAGVAIGTTLLYAYMLWKALSGDGSWLARRYAPVLAGMAMLVLVVPQLRGMAFGYIHFIVDNASTNTIANGAGLFQALNLPQHYGLGAVPFQWNALRVSWLLVALIFGIFTVKGLFIKGHGHENRRDLWLTGLLPIILFIVGKWALERVDTTQLSRTGVLSFIAVGVFLPLALVRRGDKGLSNAFVAISAIALGVMVAGASFRHIDYRQWIARPFSPELVDPANAFISGDGEGLPMIGDVFANKGRVEEIKDVKSALSRFMGPDETFLDLTNRSALYYFLNKPVPVLYSSDYVAANHKSQERMLKQIRDDPPPVVLAGPRITHDGGPASLRSYPIYREVVDSYVPEEVNGYMLLVRPQRAGRTDAHATKGDLKLLDKAFKAPDLASIPNAWGRSWERLKDRFTEINVLRPGALYNFADSGEEGLVPTGPDPRVEFGIPGTGLNAKDIDYLMFEYSCIGRKGNPVIEIYWSTDMEEMSEDTVVRFSGSGQRAIVPVGAEPRWRKADTIKAIRLDLQDNNSCDGFRVREMHLLRLN